MVIGHTLVLVDSKNFNRNDADGTDGGPSTVFSQAGQRITTVDKNGVVPDGLVSAYTRFNDIVNVDKNLSGYIPRMALPDHTYCFQMVVPSDLDAPLLVNALTVVLVSSFGPSSKWGVALYNAAGTVKLLDTGILDGTAVGVQTVAQPSVSLPFGTYWLAVNFTGSTGSYAIVGHHVAVVRAVLNQGSIKMAVAGNNSSGGQCPVSLGSLTTAQTADCALPPWIVLG